jgi:hypothetical protein
LWVYYNDAEQATTKHFCKLHSYINPSEEKQTSNSTIQVKIDEKALVTARSPGLRTGDDSNFGNPSEMAADTERLERQIDDVFVNHRHYTCYKDVVLFL